MKTVDTSPERIPSIVVDVSAANRDPLQAGKAIARLLHDNGFMILERPTSISPKIRELAVQTQWPVVVLTSSTAPRVSSKQRASRLVLSPRRQVVRDGERTIRLAPLEAAVLRELIGAPERYCSVDHLVRHIWDRRNAAESCLRVTVHSLRRKLEVDAKTPRLLLTVRRGYCLGE